MQFCFKRDTNYIFLQDFQKQREEIERLRALLTQHNIPFNSKQSKWTQLVCCQSFKFYTVLITLFVQNLFYMSQMKQKAHQ